MEIDLSKDDLLNLVKKPLLGMKQEEFEKMKGKVLRTLAEVEIVNGREIKDVKERKRREIENAKKFAIQDFAKSLLVVGDDLGRVTSATKESFSKIDASTNPAGAQQLKILLEGVEMTEKQLLKVFKMFGLEKYDPVNEELDPNRNHVEENVIDASKPAVRVAVVRKSGYILHDRVLRPTEVGVTVAVDNGELNNDPDVRECS